MLSRPFMQHGDLWSSAWQNDVYICVCVEKKESPRTTHTAGPSFGSRTRVDL